MTGTAGSLSPNLLTRHEAQRRTLTLKTAEPERRIGVEARSVFWSPLGDHPAIRFGTAWQLPTPPTTFALPVVVT